MTRSPLLFAYYGDDFTGSTDAMEVLEWGGIRTMLFMEAPAPEQLAAQFPDVQAIGIAGVGRSLSPDEMDGVLPPAFQALQSLGAGIVHYKVCSTFDSSPITGSIGHAIELGVKTFGEQLVPVVVGAPSLRRYVVFGNLFAHVGGVTYRLDRHPTMSKHPATPMTESDLGLHLGRQTKRRISSVNLFELDESVERLAASIERLRGDGEGIILFDTLNDLHLQKIGELLTSAFAQERTGKTAFVVGSSGVEKAMVLHWRASKRVEEPTTSVPIGAVDQIIVMSGSASPVSAAQIEWARENGFAAVRMDTLRLVDSSTQSDECARVVAAALQELTLGHSVVLFSALGSGDPMIQMTKDRLLELNIEPHAASRILGAQQGLILRELLRRSSVRRVAIAGGDTGGYTARQLDIYALQAIAPIAPGAPLCRAYAHSGQIDGLQIALKGGQIGPTHYYDQIRRGSA